MSRSFAEEVLKVRRDHSAAFPAKQKVHRFVDDLIELLFPHFSGEFEYFASHDIEGVLAVLGRDLKQLLKPQQANMSRPADEVTERFFAELPEIYRKLWRDAQAIHSGDPASQSVDEVIAASQNGERYQAERLPAYTLADAGLTYRFKVGAVSYTHLTLPTN